MFQLTNEQRVALEIKLKQARDASERNRICVILGYVDGHSVEELSKVLRLSAITVSRYLIDYDSDQKTRHGPRGGSDSKLSAEQSQLLLKHLSETTYLKVKQICTHVKKEYGISYSRSGMTAWLEHHDFAYKRPKKVPGKLDPGKQQVFIKEYEELKANLKLGEEIHFIDAVHPEHQSQAVCGWIKKGVQKTLQTTGKQLRLHLAGSICLTGMKVFTQEYETIDAEAMIDFFKKLENQSSASTIYVILDNARSNKNKSLDKFLETSRIKIRYLPPYSPNLNPIERLWKIMREIKLYNRYYESSVDFFREIRGFFNEDIPRLAHTWQTRINDKFQSIKLDPVKLFLTL